MAKNFRGLLYFAAPGRPIRSASIARRLHVVSLLAHTDRGRCLKVRAAHRGACNDRERERERETAGEFILHNHKYIITKQ